jgi:hypothetical protein
MKEELSDKHIIKRQSEVIKLLSSKLKEVHKEAYEYRHWAKSQHFKPNQTMERIETISQEGLDILAVKSSKLEDLKRGTVSKEQVRLFVDDEPPL